jgi:hypothetical protein
VLMLVYTADCHSERHSEWNVGFERACIALSALSETPDGKHVEAGCAVPKDNQNHECRSNSELARQTTEEALGFLYRHIFLWLGSSLPCA